MIVDQIARRLEGCTLQDIVSKHQLRLAYWRWAIITVPLILLLGFASARLAPMGANNLWYAALAKPAATPPDWLFPVAWTAIYILLGLALAMVINARGSALRGAAIGLFVVQLVINLIWSPLFFGAHQVFAALIVIVLMFAAALATTLLFGRIRAAAAWLLVPYLVWLVYAGMLNFEIHRMNPEAATLVPSSRTTQIPL
ncbi:TspO/MBR family protein [Sphingomonas qilianensis]